MKRFFLTSLLLVVCLASCKKEEEAQPIDFTKSQVGWAVGNNHGGYASLLYTSDGGEHWVRQGNVELFAETNLSYVYPYDEQLAFAGGSRVDESIVLFKTTDGGQTWVPKGENLGKGAVFGLAPITKTVILACGYLQKDDMVPAIFQSLDQGDTWAVIYSGDQDKADFFEVIMADTHGNILALGGGNNGGITAFSSDFGKTWKRGQVGSQDGVGGVIDASASGNTATLFAVGTEETLSINRSTDFGKTWTQVFSHVSLHMNGVHTLNDKEIWVAGDDLLICHSADGGDNWHMEQYQDTTQDSDEVSMNILMGVRFLANGQVGCMCGYGRDESSNEIGIVIRTVDGGKNWSRQNIPACGGLRRIFFVSSNTRI